MEVEVASMGEKTLPMMYESCSLSVLGLSSKADFPPTAAWEEGLEETASTGLGSSPSVLSPVL